VAMNWAGRNAMKQLAMTLIALGATATAALADVKLSGRVTDLEDKPVQGATVVVTGPTGVVTQATTDADGQYAITVDIGGVYGVVFASGNATRAGKVDLPVDREATLDTTLEIGGEIIEVQGDHVPLRYAKPTSDDLAIPPYSDAAILGDNWVRAWLVLDVDERGVVVRAKFLKRPGHDLDDIAVKHVFGVRFEPARDQFGRPARSYVVWKLEWPSHSWMQSRSAVMSRLPREPAMQQREGTGHGVFMDTYPPCQGTKGLVLDQRNPVLRDCSVPDLSKIDLGEAWIARDPSMPLPPIVEHPTLDPQKLRDEPILRAKRNHKLAIATMVGAGVMGVGTVLAYTQFSKYSARVDADEANHVSFDPVTLSHDQSRLTGWGLGMLGFGAGALASTVASAHFWLRSSVVTISPTGSGAALSYAGRF